MILADKLIQERKKLGLSQEELAEKLEVSRQAVSKWESAQSTPDLKRLIQMVELFGVSTDYLLKDELEIADCSADFGSSNLNHSDRIQVSLEEASRFLKLRERAMPKVALAVSFFVLSPIVILILDSLANLGHLSSELVGALGIAAIFLILGIGFVFFMMADHSLQAYEKWKKEPIETAYGVDAMVKARKAEQSQRQLFMTLFGSLVLFLCPLPVVLGKAIVGEAIAEKVDGLLVAVLLCFVALGVYFLVRASALANSYRILLQEGDYSALGKENSARIGKLATIYWPLVSALYLAISFIYRMWNMSWIIWPIAAVLFGALVALMEVRTKSKGRDEEG